MAGAEIDIAGGSPEPDAERVRSRVRSGCEPVAVDPRRCLGWWRKNFRRDEVEPLLFADIDILELWERVACCFVGA